MYLQHNSDPVVFFSPDLALREPDWLKPGQRGPDISREMGWFPLVTMWQVAQPEGWTDARTDRLVDILEAQPEYNAPAGGSSA